MATNLTCPYDLSLLVHQMSCVLQAILEALGRAGGKFEELKYVCEEARGGRFGSPQAKMDRAMRVLLGREPWPSEIYCPELIPNKAEFHLDNIRFPVGTHGLKFVAVPHRFCNLSPGNRPTTLGSICNLPVLQHYQQSGLVLAAYLLVHPNEIPPEMDDKILFFPGTVVVGEHPRDTNEVKIRVRMIPCLTKRTGKWELVWQSNESGAYDLGVPGVELDENTDRFPEFQLET